MKDIKNYSTFLIKSNIPAGHHNIDFNLTFFLYHKKKTKVLMSKLCGRAHTHKHTRIHLCVCVCVCVCVYDIYNVHIHTLKKIRKSQTIQHVWKIHVELVKYYMLRFVFGNFLINYIICVIIKVKYYVILINRIINYFNLFRYQQSSITKINIFRIIFFSILFQHINKFVK